MRASRSARSICWGRLVPASRAVGAGKCALTNTARRKESNTQLNQGDIGLSESSASSDVDFVGLTPSFSKYGGVEAAATGLLMVLAWHSAGTAPPRVSQTWASPALTARWDGE